MKLLQSTIQARLLSHARFRHMQVMVAVAEMGSLRRAAESIGLSQPSISKVIADLESMLGIALFVRHARGVTVTDACRELLVLARQTLHGVGTAAAAVAARTRQGEGTVRVAGIVAAINGLLIPSLREFTQSCPGVQVQILEGLFDDVLLSAARGEVDVVLCRQPALTPGGWSFHPLLNDEFKVFCSPSHPLIRRKKITAADLFRESWLPGHPTAASRAYLENMARDAAQELKLCDVMTILPTVNLHLLRESRLLMLAPLSVFQPHLISGDLGTLEMAQPLPFEPLGMMVRTTPMESSAQRMTSFLRHRYSSER